MENCPLTGLPCTQQKCLHVTDVKSDYTVESSKDMCVECGMPYITNGETPSVPKETAKISPMEAEAMSVFDLISSLLKEKMGPIDIKSNVKKCSGCGFTIQDISNTSRLGCPECYDCFKKELEPFIVGFHKANKHVGKIPQNKPVKIIPVKSIDDLKKDLMEAIKKEDYETAAKLRDEINKLG